MSFRLLYLDGGISYGDKERFQNKCTEVKKRDMDGSRQDDKSGIHRSVHSTEHAAFAILSETVHVVGCIRCSHFLYLYLDTAPWHFLYTAKKILCLVLSRIVGRTRHGKLMKNLFIKIE